MASQAEIGSLRVRLSMDTAEYEKGLKNADSSLDRLLSRFGLTAKGAAVAGAAIAAAFTAAAGALAVAMRSTINTMDEIGKASQKIGIPVEQLSALMHAADLSNVSLEKLSAGVVKLSRNMSEIAGGETGGTAARSLQALGISAFNASGQLKTAEQIIIEVANKFERMEDGAGKTALAFNIFGKAGADLIPLLNSGGKEIQNMTDEARELGITFDTKTAKAAEIFNDNMTRLGGVFKGFVTRLTAEVLPVLAELTSDFVTFIKNSNLVDLAVQTLSNTFRGFATAGLIVKAVFQALSDAILAVSKATAAVINMDFSGATEALKQGFGDLATNVSENIQSIKNLWTDYGTVVVRTAEDFPAKVEAPIVQSTGRMTEAARKLKEIMEEGKRVTEEMQTPNERLIAEQERIQRLMEAGAISAETYGRAMARASAFSADNMQTLASTVTSTLGKIFGENKAVAIATAIINTAAAVTKTLSAYPYPLNIALAALTAAAGAAEIATIKSTTKSGGGGGGGGGSGAAGAGSAAAAVPQAGVQQSLFVQGLSPNDMFTGDAVRNLAGKLLDFQRDGGKVVFEQ